ncbi:2-amino-4-hydroxy-6-hydroxymethyldihydropteridine diphosphokinase [Acinetobacter ihumii]|uniref:2-amino-4-hydroxy-6- hydroxymethyldihydropteridine diphosphokinase n=1 Tax=Acinetobacter ihumii TaxID=2483802 RepID=UPI00102FE9DD|nr:2-amino-4-hydroxy-6-hydroxymethyldihydropteridine diphosphokinase [Acinetobacter ihumii]
MSVVTYIGMGSNLGDSVQILREAAHKLAELGPIQVSRLYRSPPMGPQDQPHYYNAVVQLVTTLQPLDLLDQLQRFEQEAGRVRLRRWGERTLDLDVLLYADQSIENERLNVPHIGLLERDFVVLPLLDIESNLKVRDQWLRDLKWSQASTLTVIDDKHWVEK